MRTPLVAESEVRHDSLGRLDRQVATKLTAASIRAEKLTLPGSLDRRRAVDERKGAVAERASVGGGDVVVSVLEEDVGTLRAPVRVVVGGAGDSPSVPSDVEVVVGQVLGPKSLAERGPDGSCS